MSSRTLDNAPRRAALAAHLTLPPCKWSSDTQAVYEGPSGDVTVCYQDWAYTVNDWEGGETRQSAVTAVRYLLERLNGGAA